jgi:adiponectin receptor
VLGVASIVFVLHPRFQGTRWRTFRLCCFVGTGLSGFAPFIHGIKIFGVTQMVKGSGLPYYLLEGGLFLIGAVAYLASEPSSLKLTEYNF